MSSGQWGEIPENEVDHELVGIIVKWENTASNVNIVKGKIVSIDINGKNIYEVVNGKIQDLYFMVI